LKWLHYPETVPPIEYLLSAPISMPLIGFTQLLNYWIVVKITNKAPHEIRDLFKGATGHSQGKFLFFIFLKFHFILFYFFCSKLKLKCQ